MFFRKRQPTPTPPWVTWMMLGFLAFALLSNQFKGSPVQKSVENASQKLTPDKLFNAEDFKSKVFPAHAKPLEVVSETPGQGMPAICGQEVALAYEAFLPDGTKINDGAGKEKPLTFRTGQHKVIPALDEGTFGLQPGGKRTLLVAPGMAYGVKEFARDDVPADSPVRFEVELLKVEPQLPERDAAPYQIIDASRGQGGRILCGSPARVHVTLWGVDGKKLYSSREGNPITFMPGASEVFLGLDQGVLGMLQKGTRMLIVPPAFQKTMHGNAPAIAFPFPQNQTVLVDVEYVP